MLYSRIIVKFSSENSQKINNRPGYYSSIYGIYKSVAPKNQKCRDGDSLDLGSLMNL